LKKSSLWVFTGISLLIIFALTIDIGEMWSTFKKANYLVIVPGILAYFLGVWFRTWRWQVLLSGIDEIKIRTLFPIVVIGYMANNILPFRLGELIRGYYLKNKEGVPTGTALSTIFVERIMDGLALIFILAGSSMSVPFDAIFSRLSQITKLDETFLLVIFTSPFAILFGLLIAIALNGPRSMVIFGQLTSRLPRNLARNINHLTEDVVKGLYSLRNWKITCKALLLSLPIWILEAVLFHTVLVSLGILPVNSSLGHIFASSASITAITNIGASIPSMPGGIGLFEMIARETLMVIEPTSVSRSEAAAFATLTHLCLMVPIVLLGQLFLWAEGLSLRKLRHKI
jgi:uncharacterized protein (TIRG00374 family)